ncbi:MAG: Na/Pi cotransporter family protein [Fibrobacterota bacterium]
MNQFSILDLFSLAAGISIFLYGMQLGEKNLRSFSGKRLRDLITIITRNRLLAFASGLILTVLTQSSSATTVMLVSLASANLLTLHQSLGMILGSSLGTTLTVQLYAIKFQEVAPLLIAVGFFLSLRPKTSRANAYGKLVLSFGFVFFGMKMMSDSVVPLRSLPAAQSIIHNSLAYPFLGLAIGTLFTAVVQSSAATLAILITLAAGFSQQAGADLVSFIPLILGANLGTCATALISMTRANAEGHRVAWAHFLFKFAGVALFLPLIPQAAAIIEHITQSMPLQIAFTHTVFNLTISILFLPFLKNFSAFIQKTIKPRKTKKAVFEVRFIQQEAPAFPVLALTQASREISHMSTRVHAMVEKGKELIQSFSPQLKAKIKEMDDEVDYLHEKIVGYLTGLSENELTAEDSRRSYELLMITTDLEHIGDIVSKSIVVFAKKLCEASSPLPSKEQKELFSFYEEAVYLFSQTMKAFENNNRSVAREVFEKRATLYARFESYCKHHFERLYHHHDSSLHQTAIHVDLMEEINRINLFTFRISAHLLGIAKAE